MTSSLDRACGEVIRGVFAVFATFDGETDHSWCEALTVQLDTLAIHVQVNSDTDEIRANLLDLAPAGHKQADHPLPELQWMIGQKLIGIWTGANSRGYADFMALGVAELVPSVVVCAVASRLDIRVFNPPGKARTQTW